MENKSPVGEFYRATEKPGLALKKSTVCLQESLVLKPESSFLRLDKRAQL